MPAALTLSAELTLFVRGAKMQEIQAKRLSQKNVKAALYIIKVFKCSLTIV